MLNSVRRSEEKNLDKALDTEQVAAQSQLQQVRQSLEAEIASLLQQRASIP
ncbi:MAG: hypothetical protein JW795_10545 [Chitinivibrionales bacterium]|nr:hypothetical protein [Chitinivibrionales bacterium]